MRDARERVPPLAWVMVALGALLRAPLLGAGLVSDDYVLLAGMERRSPLGNPPWDLWRFYDGDPAAQVKLVLGGALPWWTGSTASHAFFRPLSSVVLLGVHAIAGRHAAAYYAVVLATQAAGAAVAALVLHRLLPRGAALAALAIFCVHPMGTGATTWISAIHVLLATAAGLAGWWLHRKWRDDGWAPGRVASLTAFAAALLAGEAGLIPLAYVVADELGSSSRQRESRMIAIAPFAVLGAGYVALYAAFHRGAHAIEGYLDPGAGLGRAATTLGARLAGELPRLVTAPAETLGRAFGPGAASIAALVLVAATVALVGSALAFDRASLRACVPWVGATIAGATAALLGPTDRALYPALLGAAATIGILVASAWRRAAAGTSRARRALRGAAAATGAIVLAAQAGAGAWSTFDAARGTQALSADELRAVSGLGIAAPESANVVVVLADDQPSGPWGGLLFEAATGARPRSWQALSLTGGPHSLGRVADDAIELAPAGGAPFFMHLYRDAHAYPMHVGDRVAAAAGLTAEVVAVAEGRPTRVRFRADRSLDDPSFVFATRGREGLVLLRLPPVGKGMWLP